MRADQPIVDTVPARRGAATERAPAPHEPAADAVDDLGRELGALVGSVPSAHEVVGLLRSLGGADQSPDAIAAMLQPIGNHVTASVLELLAAPIDDATPPTPSWVAGAEADNRAHPTLVARFNQATDGSCLGPSGDVDVEKVAAWQAERGLASTGTIDKEAVRIAEDESAPWAADRPALPATVPAAPSEHDPETLAKLKAAAEALESQRRAIESTGRH